MSEAQKTHTVVYHSNCADGFGAAWVVRKRLLEDGIKEDEIEFIPGVYNNFMLMHQYVNRHLTIVDFSFPRAEMEKISSYASKMVWIDHHKTAIEDMQNYKGKAIDGVRTVERSGAYLAWQYFFGGDKNIPQLIRHIDDRDRWQFKLPFTREIQANIFSYPYDFKVWDELMMLDGDLLEVFGKEGEAIERKHFKDIHELLELCAYQTTLAGHPVMAANMPYTMSSDAGNILAKKHSDCAFAVIWYRKSNGNVYVSLRSVGDFDVSAIAKQFGGGGHKNAAGFEVQSLMELGW